MKRKTSITSALFAATVMALLIVDTKTAVTGAAEGVDLCIKVIVPSLFPFFIVTTYLNASILGLRIPGLSILGSLLRVPAGGESLLLLGLIGGYPVGAQLISDAYQQDQIDKRTGQILLGYCNNAGPAFIFGVAGALFSYFWIPFILWGVHLFSAIATGFILPRPHFSTMSRRNSNAISIVQALQKSISICASVCGWVVVFKTIMAYVSKWFTHRLNKNHMILLTGILELSNGCLSLSKTGEAARFVLCAVFLAFGGICVMLQTLSVTKVFGLGLYIPGKIIQSCISLQSALLLSYILFPESTTSVHNFIYITLICSLIIIVTRKFAEKSCGNPGNNHV